MVVDALSADWDDAASGASTVHGSFSHRTEDAIMPSIDSNNTALDSAKHQPSISSRHKTQSPASHSSKKLVNTQRVNIRIGQTNINPHLANVSCIPIGKSDSQSLITNSKQLSGQVPLLH